MAKLIKMNTEIVDVEPANGEYFSLQEIQDHVGGYFTMIRLDEFTLMLMDEEASPKGVQVNVIATELVKEFTRHPHDILGPVLVVKNNEIT